MDPELNDQELDKKIKERFKQLPKVLQDAITSADIQKHLRSLAETQKLHVDQWGALENEVMLTLLGFQKPSELANNLQKGIDVTEDVANALALDISQIVFEPIREELERELDNPDAKAASVSGVEAAGAQAMRDEATPVPVPLPPAPPPVVPGTPPTPPPTEKAVRAPISEAYKAGEPSTARKSIEDDPYREPPA